MKEEKEAAPEFSLELHPEEMRRLGYKVVDRIVQRWEDLRNGPPWQFATRRELEPLLSGPPPEAPGDPDELLDMAVQEILSRAGRIDHPRFFAFIPSSPTWPSILGDMLATGFNIFQGTWLESAGPSQLELVVLDWFRGWLGFPESGGGLLTSGGSVANLIALVTAREWAGGPRRPSIYVSDQGHSSLERAARIIGVQEDAIRRIPTDDHFRMDTAILRQTIASDRDIGLNPLCICGNAGATNTGAIDPLEALSQVAEEEGLWLHVDGAYGGFGILAPGVGDSFRGIEKAHSVTLDPHKWLFQPYETGCLLVRDTRLLESAFRILPEYLQDTALGEEQVNFADRGVQLTRGFRALKVWLSLKTLGLRAFREAIQQGIDHAKEAERWIQASEDLEMMGPASLGIVCFRFNPARVSLPGEALDELNLAIQNEIVGSGVAMMSSTRLRNRFSLRMSILNYRSTWEDVRDTLQAVKAAGRKLVRGGAASW